MILDIKLKIIDNMIKINIKTEPPVIKSRMAESFKNSDKNNFVFSKEINAIKADIAHFDSDRNSLTKPLDKPKNDDNKDNEIIIMSVTSIF